MKKKNPTNNTSFLFDEPLSPTKAKEDELRNAPLSFRMRPVTLDAFIGQKHILGEGKLLTRAVEADRLASLIFYGPPGTGKTTLATCISHHTKSYFEAINAVCSNVEELRQVLNASRQRQQISGQKTILFIDEIHRFNKAQQDVLMPDLEKGAIMLIGATVLNPFFTLIGPLLSRSMVFELKSHTQEDIKAILTRALKDTEKGLGRYHVDIDQEALTFLSKICDGDARRALNALEISVLTTKENKEGRVHVTLGVAEESIQKKQLLYDRDGDGHYDTASAFIKSMRGSDPDAALYWLAKMIYAGEDPRFIARRICICAAEDVGNADPQALVVANAAFQVSEFVGLPEARIPLAQAAVYVACAPKSNASYLGIEKALSEVSKERLGEVPAHLKDASYKSASKLDHGQGYKYAHDYPHHYVVQEYMPLKAKFYEPTSQGFEEQIQKHLKKLKGLS